MAIEMADFVLTLLERIPHHKHLRLISQMEGAVTSVPQNITEGKGRQHKKEFIQFLSIAQASLYETITLNELFRRRSIFEQTEGSQVRAMGEKIDRKLNGLMNSLKGIKRPIPGKKQQ